MQLGELEKEVRRLTHSSVLVEQRKPKYNLKRIMQKVAETLRNPRLKGRYIHGLENMLLSFTRPIETRKQKLREKELRKTHYFVNMHYHSGFPFSLDAARVRNPFASAVKHMRKFKVKVLYVTDHDNNLFFWELKNHPPKWIQKRYDISGDNWMLVLSPKKRRFRKRKNRRPLYIMNAKEEHIRLSPNTEVQLNLEMGRPTNQPVQRASFPCLEEFLYSAYDTFGTLNHANLHDSFEYEVDVDRAFGLASRIGTRVFMEWNGGTTPIQGYSGAFVEQYLEKNPGTPVSVGSDAHRHDIKPAGVWIEKSLLKPALESGSGFLVNIAVRDALLANTGVVQRRIFSNPSKVIGGYVWKKVVG